MVERRIRVIGVAALVSLLCTVSVMGGAAASAAAARPTGVDRLATAPRSGARGPMDALPEAQSSTEAAAAAAPDLHYGSLCSGAGWAAC